MLCLPWILTNRYFDEYVYFAVKYMYIDFHECMCFSLQIFHLSERRFVKTYIRCNHCVTRGFT